MVRSPYGYTEYVDINAGILQRYSNSVTIIIYYYTRFRIKNIH